MGCEWLAEQYNMAGCCEVEPTCDCVSTLTIVAIVLASIFGILAVVLLVLYCRKRKAEQVCTHRQKELRTLSSINRKGK